MKVHFIAIGGAVMHNLAISLRNQGIKVTGSDDEIYEPAYTNLKNADLLPAQLGWFPENITSDLDAVILGMHAKEDNIELIKARSLGLKIYSFPAYVFEQTKNKKRVVIAGSHGKTTITSMVMHVLRRCGRKFDYLVGSRVPDFELTVNFSAHHDLAVIEGDEYLSSALERYPKFHQYKPHIAVITGIAWDHINVFPTFENYLRQFEIFIGTIEKNGVLIYCNNDEPLKIIVSKARNDIRLLAYDAAAYTIKNNQTFIQYQNKQYPLQIFGKHNMYNLHAAWLVCRELNITDEAFLNAMQSFKGASKRLELMAKTDRLIIYRDFAHAPSKLKATIKAVREMYPGRKLVACMELHTFSSLNKQFLTQYRHSMNEADVPVVFLLHHAVEMKKLPPIHNEEIVAAFDDKRLQVVNDSAALLSFLEHQTLNDSVLLMMSSGNFGGLDWTKLNQLA
jgi:UDP-N-acetylmuramate: L-alanyl-gamma-D-glutamyl-meso-diaminopimelate ligase